MKTNVVEKVKTFCKLKKITQDKRVVKHVFLVSDNSFSKDV